ncbi:LysE family translocator [Afifella pfennigii]|uniref:LysE family translocator n=1 Tax=Afifella pfennigii TaxID=209897 RepID=UPI00047D8814|nr:LysE family translocator [Afifella pfennigii]
MSALAALASALLLFVVAAIAPGPSNVLIVETSLSRGARPALALAFGVSTGSFLWALGSALGIGIFLLESAAYPYLVVLGAIVLFKLAADSARQALRQPVGRKGRAGPRPAETGAEERLESDVRGAGKDAAPGALTERPLALMGKGLVVSLSNPKSALFWIAVMSLALQPDAAPSLLAAIVLGCTALAVVIYSGFAMAVQIPALRELYAQAIAALRWGFAALYLVFAAKMLSGIVWPGPTA